MVCPDMPAFMTRSPVSAIFQPFNGCAENGGTPALLHYFILKFSILLCQLSRNGLITKTDFYAVRIRSVFCHICNIVIKNPILHHSYVQKTFMLQKRIVFCLYMSKTTVFHLVSDSQVRNSCIFSIIGYNKK